MARAAELEDIQLPAELMLEPVFSRLPDSSWFGIEVSFTLETPWYSKDDRPFHVLDNPVRKDRIFSVPFMSAASWKGLLRWAFAMKNGLVGPYPESDQETIKSKKKQIVHLFGNEKGEQKDFRSGALVFYPTWFTKIGFEVINPHSRSRRAGTQPIYYEVVPAGTKGRLRLLYAPLPGEIENDKVTPADFINSFIDSIRALLETYGISAKRTAGWGTARIDTWTGLLKASDEPAKVEHRSTKKTLHSLQDLGTLVHEQIPAGSFTLKDAEEFKAEMKSRIARKGGDQ
jgi:CRISPR-associated protein Cmr2